MTKLNLSYGKYDRLKSKNWTSLKKMLQILTNKVIFYIMIFFLSFSNQLFKKKELNATKLKISDFQYVNKNILFETLPSPN